MNPARRPTVLALLLALVLVPVASARAATAIVKVADGWQLQVDGKPYVAKGVTFSGSRSADYEQDCARLAALGVNTLRTWGTGTETRVLLDAAHKHGLKVLVGLWLRQGRPGAESDDSFDYTRDSKGMKKQLTDTLAQVRHFKDHPAVLAWGIGNEVLLNSPDDASKEAYARFLEQVVREVKKVDAGHPVSTTARRSTTPGCGSACCRAPPPGPRGTPSARPIPARSPPRRCLASPASPWAR